MLLRVSLLGLMEWRVSVGGGGATRTWGVFPGVSNKKLGSDYYVEVKCATRFLSKVIKFGSGYSSSSSSVERDTFSKKTAGLFKGQE